MSLTPTTPTPTTPTTGSLTRGTAAELRAELARQKKTQRELAEVWGVTPKHAGKLINGEKPMDLDHVQLAADFLDVDVFTLMGLRPNGSVG